MKSSNKKLISCEIGWKIYEIYEIGPKLMKLPRPFLIGAKTSNTLNWLEYFLKSKLIENGFK